MEKSDRKQRHALASRRWLSVARAKENMPEKLLLNINEAAECVRLSPWTLRLYIRQGKLHIVRIGRRVLIEPAELERIISAGRQAGARTGGTL